MSKKRKPQHQSRRQSRRRPPRPEPRLYEAVTAAGLEPITRREISALLGKRVTLLRVNNDREPGVVRFSTTGGPRALLRLKTVQAVYLSRRFAVPRPRALLGDAYLRLLLADIAEVQAVHPRRAFQTVYLSAAGSQTAVLRRLMVAICEAAQVSEGDEEGDLLLRLRRPPGNKAEWEVLVRISPRPLATRSWRVCNMEGALNATVAHTMALMTDPRSYDVYLNIGCGSGTLLVERAACGPARQIIGCDTDPETLDCARLNLEAAGLAEAVRLHDWDARHLPLDTASVDALSADLPFGHLVGSHDENLTLYPALLAEAARVAKPGALFALITHEINLTRSLLDESAVWQLASEQRVALGGLYPRIFVLQRTQDAG